MQNLRSGEWRGKGGVAPLGRDPEGKVLGVLGLGGIGTEVARRAGGLGMRVWYHNRKPLAGAREEEAARLVEGGVRYVGFEELLAGADVLSVNVPLNVSVSSPPRTPFPPFPAALLAAL